MLMFDANASKISISITDIDSVLEENNIEKAEILSLSEVSANLFDLFIVVHSQVKPRKRLSDG